MHAVGRSLQNRRNPDPTPTPLRVYRAFGTYYYVQPLDSEADTAHTSGSPVIDRGGRVVGLVSGAVGRLGVVGGYPTCDVYSVATMYPIGYLGIDPASSVYRPRAWASGLPGRGPLWAARYNVAKEKLISETHEIWND